MTQKAQKFTEVKVLQDGTRDAAILLTLWYLRRLFWPLVLLGVLGGILADDVEGDGIDFSNPESVLAGMLSPLVGLGVAVLLKTVVGFLAKLATYPLLKERLKLMKGEKYGYFFTRWLDRWQIMKGVSDLRWTHHVRQEAAQRMRPKLIRDDTLNKYMDIALIVLIILTISTFIGVSL